MTTLLIVLAVTNAITASALVFALRAFLIELQGLLDYQDRLLDRIQAPDAAIRSAGVRLGPPRTKDGPKPRYIRSRAGVVRVREPADVDDDSSNE